MDFKKIKLPFGKKPGSEDREEPAASQGAVPPQKPRRFSFSFGKKAKQAADDSASAAPPNPGRSFKVWPVKKSNPQDELITKEITPARVETPTKPLKNTARKARGGKHKAFKATRGEKFVLFVGDEGAILVYIKGNAVQSRQFVPDASPSSLADLKRALANDTKAPVMLVVDNMDQTYMQQTLPPVSSMSVGKLIKRRLDRDFGANDIKGAIVLGREKTGRKDWNFLMVALEKTQALTAWMEFCMSLPNRLTGINLVSVESEVLVKGLESAMGFGKKGSGSEWKFFVSHNKVGGFRQVILRNGRIIFTRLAQPLSDPSPEVVAGSIEQEMLSTIEYMKRLSFNPQSGLDIYIVASAGIKSAIDSSKFNATSLHVFTPFEVAQYLGIEGATQPTDQFGDVILAATIGCSRTHVLTLQTAESGHINRYFPMIGYQRKVAAAIAVGLIGYSGYIGYNIFTISGTMDDLEQKKQEQQVKLDAIKAESKKNNVDIEATNDLLDAYLEIQAEKTTPITFIKQLEPITELPVWIKQVTWRSDPESKNTGQPESPLQSPEGFKMMGTLSLEFPAVTNDPSLFTIAAKKILTDVQKLYPKYEVHYEHLPAGFVETDKKEIDFTGDELNTDDAASKPMPEAEMHITETPRQVQMKSNMLRPGPGGAMSPEMMQQLQQQQMQPPQQ